MVTGTFLVGSVSDSSALPCLSPPAVFNKEPASSQRWLEETILMPGRLGTWWGGGKASPLGVSEEWSRQGRPGTGPPPRPCHPLPSQPVPSSGSPSAQPGPENVPWEETHPWETWQGLVSYELSTFPVPGHSARCWGHRRGQDRHSCRSGGHQSPLERESGGNQILTKQEDGHRCSRGSHLTTFVSHRAPFQFLAELPEPFCWTHPDRPHSAPGSLANLRGWDRGIWYGHLSR